MYILVFAFSSTFQDEGVKIFVLLFQGEVETGLRVAKKLAPVAGGLVAGLAEVAMGLGEGKELVRTVPVVADFVAMGKDLVKKVPVVGDLVAEKLEGKELVRILPDIVSDLVAEQLEHRNVVVCCYYLLSHISYCTLAIS